MALKEWQAIQIATPDLFVNAALFDAKLLQLLQVKIYDRTRGRKHLHERQLRPGAFRVADQLVDSSTAYRDRRGMLRFDNRFGAGRIEVEIDLQASRHCPRIAGRLVIYTDRGASQVVSLPLSGQVGMYSHKGMFPVEGELVVGADTPRSHTYLTYAVPASRERVEIPENPLLHWRYSTPRRPHRR